MPESFDNEKSQEKTISIASKRKISLDYEIGCESDGSKPGPANAYSITLASEDGSYGLKSVNPSEIIYASGTAVDNPSTGLYEKTFNITPGAVYTASWKIMRTASTAPLYEVEQLGPYSQIEDKSIRAVATTKGTYKTGTTAYLFLKVTKIGGDAIDPTSTNITIRDPSNIEEVLDIPEKLALGYYLYEWEIDKGADLGQYSIIWSYTVDDVEEFEYYKVVVTEDVETVNSIYNKRATVLRTALERRLECAQCIPIYGEQAKPTIDYKRYDLTFPNWNQTAGIRVFRNDRNNIIQDSLDVNFFNGYITFDNKMTVYDRIYVDYNFRWFDDEELHGYLVDAVNSINMAPPSSTYTINTLPDSMTTAVILHAAAEALRKLLLCLNFQQPRQIFGGDDKLSDAFSNIDTIKKNYEEEWKYWFDLKKFGPYPRIAVVSTPEYTLPGGRSRWFRYLFSN